MINYLTSEHVKCLQQSRYIKIETEVDKLMKHKNRCKNAAHACELLGLEQWRHNSEFYARYCKEEEVFEKNQMFLNFKGQFYAKLKQIESNGHNLVVQEMVDNWIEGNCDSMYADMIAKHRQSMGGVHQHH